MAKKFKKTVQKWTYEHYFSGLRSVFSELDTPQHVVAASIPDRGNWIQLTLKKAGVVKHRGEALIA